MMDNKTMQAAVLYAPGDLRIEKCEIPQIGEGEVLVRVRACGVCGSDLPRILHTGTYHFPTIPGHEFSGEIVAVPPGETKWKPGDRVAVAPLMPCGTCESCRAGNFGQCDCYDFLGSRRDGAFAEFVAAPIKNLLSLPENVSFEEGAMIEPAAVTMHGMFKTALDGADVAILGVGAIGIFAVALAKLMGARKVFAVDVAEEKLEMAKRYGADCCINSCQCDAVERIESLTDGTGVPVVIEAAGNKITQEQALRMAKAHGEILFLGTAHKTVEFPPASFERIIRRELVLLGSWNSYSSPFPGEEWRSTIRFLAEGKLDLKPMISRKLSLADLPKTLLKMEARAFDYAKVLVTFPEK